MYQIYQAMSNESLEDVANKLGVDIEELMMLNGMNPNDDLTGMFIVVPKGNETYKKYIVKKGDSIYSIARSHNVDYQTLLRLNGLEEGDYIYPNQEIIIPNGKQKMYVVEENETIKSISNKLGKDMVELINENEDIYLVPDQIIKY